MSPNDAIKNPILANENMYRRHKFKVGDKVRISLTKKVFEKGFTPNWSEEVFVVDKVLLTIPVTYALKDLAGEPIVGSFYEQELQKTEQDVFVIEKVIRKKGNKSLVKWRGYSDKFNSWIPTKQITK
jgi:transcription antitermination factor NusA-like protein